VLVQLKIHLEAILGKCGNSFNGATACQSPATEIICHASQMGVGMVTAKPYYLKAAPTKEFLFGYSALWYNNFKKVSVGWLMF